MNIFAPIGAIDLEKGIRTLTWWIQWKDTVCLSCGEVIPAKTVYVKTYSPVICLYGYGSYSLCEKCGVIASTEYDIEIEDRGRVNYFETMEEIRGKSKYME